MLFRMTSWQTNKLQNIVNLATTDDNPRLQVQDQRRGLVGPLLRLGVLGWCVGGGSLE